MRPNMEHHTVRKLFAGYVEHAFFAEVGLCDPRLTDYLVMMLIEFIHVDRLYRFSDEEGRRVETIAGILELVQGDQRISDSGPRRDLHRYIGDFALFWTGVFPEGLRGARYHANPDHLINYVDRGKESYAIASELADERSDPPRSLLKRLSTQFEVCAHGLGIVRQGWEQCEWEGPGEPGMLLY